MINSRVEAEALVRACKYPPRGYRSFGPVRASIYAAQICDHANDQLSSCPYRDGGGAEEPRTKPQHTPAWTGFTLGRADLSLALGCKPRLDQTILRWWRPSR